MADTSYTGGVYFPDSRQQELRSPDPVSEPDLTGEASSFGGAVRVMGAVGSMALVVGIGVWGYKLVMRDVSGVPVVRALEGPMRIQPEKPGGLQADHQGLAVNAVAAAGSAAPTADRLMLAPKPVELSEEDKPIGQVAQQDSPDAVQPAKAAASPEDLASLSVEALVEQLSGGTQSANSTDTVTETATVTDTDSPAAQDAPAGQPEVMQADAPITEVAPDYDAPDADNPDVELEVAPAIVTGPGVRRSLRPLARPARAVSSGDTKGTDTVLATAINTAVDAVANLEVDPESLPAGTRLAQLGAYDSVEVAREEWGRMSLKFEDYMEGKQRVIQKASSGGRTFYRLRAMGFDDLSAARRFCSALVAENADCIPVTTR